jgi:hypothetical protein
LSDGADIGSGCARSADTIVPAQTEELARAVLRQLNRRFAFIPWRRAISATEAPGQSVSATILRFSLSDHDRRRRFATAVGIGEPGIRRAVLNDTVPPSHAIMSISTLMDISPTSSGSSDYPRTLADQVGGRGLTLTGVPGLASVAAGVVAGRIIGRRGVRIVLLAALLIQGGLTAPMILLGAEPVWLWLVVDPCAVRRLLRPYHRRCSRDRHRHLGDPGCS